jgi:hypothetical protein
MKYSLKKLIFSTRCNSKVPLNDKREGVMQQDSIKVNLSDLEVIVEDNKDMSLPLPPHLRRPQRWSTV